MKTDIKFGKRLLALTLALVYVFAISTYIVFLSSRTHVHHHHRHAGAAQVQRLSAGGAAGNFYDKQHGTFKTTFPNKRNVVSAIYSLVCLAVLALFSTLRLFYVNRLTDVVAGLMYPGRPCYLSLRVLRI
jgi:hypothetical protein